MYILVKYIGILLGQKVSFYCSFIGDFSHEWKLTLWSDFLASVVIICFISLLLIPSINFLKQITFIEQTNEMMVYCFTYLTRHIQLFFAGRLHLWLLRVIIMLSSLLVHSLYGFYSQKILCSLNGMRIMPFFSREGNTALGFYHEF